MAVCRPNKCHPVRPAPPASPSLSHCCYSMQWWIQRGDGAGRPPPLLAQNLFLKSRLFPCKDILFVECICDKQQRGLYIVFRPRSKFLDPLLTTRAIKLSQLTINDSPDGGHHMGADPVANAQILLFYNESTSIQHTSRQKLDQNWRLNS